MFASHRGLLTVAARLNQTRLPAARTLTSHAAHPSAVGGRCGGAAHPAEATFRVSPPWTAGPPSMGAARRGATYLAVGPRGPRCSPEPCWRRVEATPQAAAPRTRRPRRLVAGGSPGTRARSCSGTSRTIRRSRSRVHPARRLPRRESRRARHHRGPGQDRPEYGDDGAVAQGGRGRSVLRQPLPGDNRRRSFGSVADLVALEGWCLRVPRGDLRACGRRDRVAG